MDKAGRATHIYLFNLNYLLTSSSVTRIYDDQDEGSGPNHL